MTELRDARLKRALHAAPDAFATAADTTRHAIRDAAMKAVAPAPDAVGWRRWLPGPRSRMPWNAAFATVLLAVLIGVMWRDEELPDTRRESAPPPAVAPVPAPAPVAASATAPVPPAAPIIAPSAAPKAPVLNDARTREAPLAKTIPPAVRAAASEPAPPPAATAKAADTLAAGAPKSADSVRRDAAPAAEARNSAPAPAAAPRAAAPQARMQRAAIAPPAWTELRIESGGRSMMVPRSQAAGLAASVDRLLAGAGTQEDLQWQPDVAIELMIDGRRVGSLELAGDQVRVTEPGVAQHTGRPGGRILQQVREEIARLLAR